MTQTTVGVCVIGGVDSVAHHLTEVGRYEPGPLLKKTKQHIINSQTQTTYMGVCLYLWSLLATWAVLRNKKKSIWPCCYISKENKWPSGQQRIQTANGLMKVNSPGRSKLFWGGSTRVDACSCDSGLCCGSKFDLLIQQQVTLPAEHCPAINRNVM